MLLCGMTTDEQVKIELLSQWMLEAEFRKKNYWEKIANIGLGINNRAR